MPSEAGYYPGVHLSVSDVAVRGRRHAVVQHLFNCSRRPTRLVFGDRENGYEFLSSGSASRLGMSRLILSYPEMVLGPFQAAYFGPADYYRLCLIWS